MSDNSVAMKENLIKSLERLRIEAQCDVLELGDNDISEFAYERTLKLREREEFLSKIADENVFNLPSSSSSLSVTGDQHRHQRKPSIGNRLMPGLMQKLQKKTPESSMAAIVDDESMKGPTSTRSLNPSIQNIQHPSSSNVSRWT